MVSSTVESCPQTHPLVRKHIVLLHFGLHFLECLQIRGVCVPSTSNSIDLPIVSNSSCKVSSLLMHE